MTAPTPESVEGGTSSFPSELLPLSAEQPRKPESAAGVNDVRVARLAADVNSSIINEVTLETAKTDSDYSWPYALRMLEQQLNERLPRTAAEVNTNGHLSLTGRYAQLTEREYISPYRQVQEVEQRTTATADKLEAEVRALTAEPRLPPRSDAERTELLAAAQAIGREAERRFPNDPNGRSDWLREQMNDPEIAHVFANVSYWIWGGSRALRDYVVSRVRPGLDDATRQRVQRLEQAVRVNRAASKRAAALATHILQHAHRPTLAAKGLVSERHPIEWSLAEKVQFISEHGEREFAKRLREPRGVA